jgi:hypothetical protein
LFEDLVANKKVFEDKDFPPNDKSLGPKEVERLKKSKHVIRWQRPNEFPKVKDQKHSKDEWSLFVSDGSQLISPEDI